MNTPLKPTVALISSAFFMASLAHAAGGGAGGQGTSSGVHVPLIGGLSVGSPGSYSRANESGGNAASISEKTINIGHPDTQPMVIIGMPGEDGGNRHDFNGNDGLLGGSGAGGNGGAFVSGGISIGGAGGHSIESAANGGNGGNISGNTITLNNTTLQGAKGGASGSSGAFGAGGGGNGGNGGGTVVGGISTGGAAGVSDDLGTAYGGNGGEVRGNTITLTNTILEGANGGQGGDVSSGGGGGSGGHGGGSVLGGISIGGAGGKVTAAYGAADGGHGAEVSDNVITLRRVSLTGGAGGNGGVSSGGGGNGGVAGDGGGSVVGGISTGGATGYGQGSTEGGRGGNVYGNTIFLIDSSLKGGAGGRGGAGGGGSGGDAGHGGGSVFGGISTAGAGGIGNGVGSGGDVYANTITLANSYLEGATGGEGGAGVRREGGGAGGHGGGSVFGGVSTGGAAGVSNGADAESGGHGGVIRGNTITLTDSILQGAVAGKGGNADLGYGGGGAGGHGGGSVFGGVSTGGAGGVNFHQSSDGGAGGEVSGNTIRLANTSLRGAAGGAGGDGNSGAADGAAGLDGGSVFGGVSIGGAGGNGGISAAGGNGGNVMRNTITLSGTTNLTGHIYGGYSQGGTPGEDGNGVSAVGIGGHTSHNTVTLIGQQLSIAGDVYGGRSLNGDGQENADASFSSFYQGNTLNLQGFKGAAQGIYHFQNYNWLLPNAVTNQSTVIEIAGGVAVDLSNTNHTIAMEGGSNRLKPGDTVVLIEKAQGTQLQTPTKMEQGNLITYDITTEVTNGNQFVLHIDSDPNLNPRSKAFLMGRLPMLAITNQGGDMMAGAGLEAARWSVGSSCGTNLFAVSEGGSSRYDTGSHIKLRDFKLAIGGAKCFELPSQSTAMAGAFVEYGRGNYDSFNSFGSDGDVHGWGHLHYTGLGVMAHMNVAGTGTGKASDAPSIQAKDGLYLNAVLRGGKVKMSFDSGLTSAQGVPGHYDSTSNYANVMAGVGYAWVLDDKQLVDLYGRYSWNRVQADSVTISNTLLELGSMQSSRVRLGARYQYEVNPQTKPYAGIAYEREFKGSASGSVLGMSIDQPTLKGSTGIVELGVDLKPSTASQAWTINMRIQAYAGERRGVSGGVMAKYAF